MSINLYQAFVMTKKLSQSGSKNAWIISSEDGSYHDPDNSIRLVTNDGRYIEWNYDGELWWIGDRNNREEYYQSEATKQDNDYVRSVIEEVLG